MCLAFNLTGTFCKEMLLIHQQILGVTERQEIIAEIASGKVIYMFSFLFPVSHIGSVHDCYIYIANKPNVYTTSK